MQDSSLDNGDSKALSLRLLVAEVELRWYGAEVAIVSIDPSGQRSRT